MTAWQTKVARGWGMATSLLRRLPDFIIIGAQRAGTTSLYNYVAAHPDVAPAYFKETHFFDNNFERGIAWYRSFFPFRWRAGVTGEATPYYLFHPYVARRVAALLPEVKLIALLRNPIDRAYSHYHHEVRLGAEKAASFEAALARERELLPQAARALREPPHRSYEHQHVSYRARGVYVDQVQRWFEHFPREQVLILPSEMMYDDPQAALDRVLALLGLPSWSLPHPRRYNEARYAPMASETRAELAAYFAPHNRRLYDLLGVDFGWA